MTNEGLVLKRRYILKTLSAAVVASAGLAAPLAISQPRSLPGPLPYPIDRRYFGMHIHGIAVRRTWVAHGERLTQWPELEFGTWRLWDAYVAWPNLQPQKHRWDFAVLDLYVDLARERNVEVILPLGLTPTWASARPDEKSSYKLGNAAEPADLEDWRIYVRTVATRYKGRIRLYEMWNEINLKGFYTGSLEVMVNLTRIAYQEIKGIDPDAIVVSPSVTGDAKNPEWLDRYLYLGGRQYCDVVGYHFYVPARSPEAMVPLVDRVREILRKHDLQHKPLWNTESGWWIENLQATTRLGAAHESWKRLHQEAAAAYVSRALILGWASGVSRFCWYAWDNSDMGLFDIRARMLKPAARAYARTASWMIGATMRGCNEHSGVWVCDLIDARKNPFRIVWRATGDSLDWSVPLSWMASTFETLNGDSGPQGRMISLGQQPVLIR